jgi:hypothetical protein
MNFQRNTVESPHKSEVRLSGGFATNGASSPATVYGNWIQSVTRDGGAGIFLVTLKPDFRGMRNKGKQVSLQLAAVADSKAVIGPYDAVLGTLRVWTVTGAAPADIAADANNIVWLDLTMSYTTIGDGSGYDS